MSSFVDHAGEVFLVDDDLDFAHVVETLATQARFVVHTYCSAQRFLREYVPAAPGCLLLDFCLPVMNGFDALVELRRQGHTLPVVFITGNSDVRLAVEVMKLGAIDYLMKPFSLSALLQAIHNATEVSRQLFAKEQQQKEGQRALAQLTDRERSVVQRLARGEETKTVARALRLSPKTVEYHRTRAFRKLGVENVVEMSYFVWHGHGAPQNESSSMTPISGA